MATSGRLIPPMPFQSRPRMSAEGRFHLAQFAQFGAMQHAEQTGRWHRVAKLCADCKRDQ
jgi:hypothetical protein